jgi:Arc/MetJ-type ribon-helix-helix transcriptional regulator
MKNKLEVLMEKGLYDNQSEVVREALRNLFLIYKRELDNQHAKK